MRACEIYAIAGDAVLGRNRDTTSLKSVLDGKLKWVERHILYVGTEVLSTGSGIFKVLPEQVLGLATLLVDHLL